MRTPKKAPRSEVSLNAFAARDNQQRISSARRPQAPEAAKPPEATKPPETTTRPKPQVDPKPPIVQKESVSSSYHAQPTEKENDEDIGDGSGPNVSLSWLLISVAI